MARLKHADCRVVFVIAFLLSLSVTCNWVGKNNIAQKQTSTDNRSILQQFVPERLRSFVAARYWARADLLMHRGPFPGSGQKYQAGSYAGNSDIVPLLQLVIAIMPEELAPYQLLARCLAGLPGQHEAGLKVLQQGILVNSENAALHEMYAAIAWLKLFAGDKPDKNIMISAAKYLEKALTLSGKSSLSISSDPAFNEASYQTLLARLYLELGRPEKALVAWQSSHPEKAASDNDLLASTLGHYRDHGVLPEVTFPPFMSVENSIDMATAPGQAQVHEHSENCGCHAEGKNDDPLPSPVSRTVAAGLLVCFMFVLSRFMLRD